MGVFNESFACVWLATNKTGCSDVVVLHAFNDTHVVCTNKHLRVVYQAPPGVDCLLVAPRNKEATTAARHQPCERLEWGSMTLEFMSPVSIRKTQGPFRDRQLRISQLRKPVENVYRPPMCLNIKSC